MHEAVRAHRRVELPGGLAEILRIGPGFNDRDALGAEPLRELRRGPRDRTRR